MTRELKVLGYPEKRVKAKKVDAALLLQDWVYDIYSQSDMTLYATFFEYDLAGHQAIDKLYLADNSTTHEVFEYDNLDDLEEDIENTAFDVE